MSKNVLLRSLRDALDLDEARMLRALDLVGHPLKPEELRQRLRLPKEVGAVAVTDRFVALFLDGLILDLRGPRDGQAPPAVPQRLPNNDVLKKLRIALNYREEEVLATFAAGGEPLTHYQLAAFFRSEGHKNYRALSDGMLQAFLKGLAVRRRQTTGAAPT